MLKFSLDNESTYTDSSISTDIASWPAPEVISSSNVKILNPRTMSDHKIKQLSNTIMEMWGSEHWLQELVQCSSCNKISSKKDIFWHLAKEIYDLSVWDIMKICAMNSIVCPCCKKDAQFIYGNEQTWAVRKRLLDSIHSFLIVAESHWDIVGTWLWYIPQSFMEMYQLEFQHHYQRIGVDKIKERVRMILDNDPEHMIMFAAIWFLDKYRNLFQLIEFLRLAFSDIPEKYAHLPWIMELDKNNIMYSLFTAIGGISLWFWDLDNQKSIVNTQAWYTSELVIIPNTVQLFNEHFWPHISKRDILRKLHVNKNKVSNYTH